jgi:cyclopropane-fatty-acyl-phospholipid synthase
MDHILETAFSAYVKRGSLELVTAAGKRLTVGDGGEPTVTVRFADRAAELALLWDPEMEMGELFMDGRLIVEQGSIYDLLELLWRDSHGDRSRLPRQFARRLRLLTRRFAAANTLTRAKRNVRRHYDLDDRLYSLFLDADRQYSCAYFDRPGLSLDDAQLAKKRHVTAKLLVEPGHRALDIGCGWGGLALYLAEIGGARSVKGITLSGEQLRVARRRAAQRGLGSVVSFALEDYRETQGCFDRIVSVGMFEHVGVASYDVFFQTCRRLLAEDGVMLLHTIGRSGRPCPTNPWVRRYIFPGGHLPTMSEIAPVVERSGLIVTDVEVLRLHYAETLRAWRERFLARREEAAALYDERFCRMWEFYLSGAEASFRYEDCVVFQIQLAKRNDVVPITRAYIAEREAELRAREQIAASPRLAEAGE